jgi:hypothetical protein
MDLTRFGQAIRQRWYWYYWTDDSKPWQVMTLPCDEMDRALFHASTEISLGNDEKTLFWHDRWLQGKTPEEIAPNLFKFTHFKNRMVAKELTNKNWIQSVQKISSGHQLRKIVNLWMLVPDTDLHGTEKDAIIWRWAPKGEYSTASAYKVQFQGSYKHFQHKAI